MKVRTRDRLNVIGYAPFLIFYLPILIAGLGIMLFFIIINTLDQNEIKKKKIRKVLKQEFKNYWKHNTKGMMQAGPMMNKAGEEIKELHEAFNELHTLGMMKIEIKKYPSEVGLQKVENLEEIYKNFMKITDKIVKETIYSIYGDNKYHHIKFKSLTINYSEN